MTDQTDAVEGAGDVLADEDFDLVEFLSGGGYPEKQVTVNPNQLVAAKIAELNTKIAEIAPGSAYFERLPNSIAKTFRADYLEGLKESDAELGDKINAIDDEINKLKETLALSDMILTVRSVPQDVLENGYVNIVQKETSRLRSAANLGPNAKLPFDAQKKLDDLAMSLLWALHVVRLQIPSRNIDKVPTREELDTIREKLSGVQVRRVSDAIDENYKQSAAGFEIAHQDVDFLSTN